MSETRLRFPESEIGNPDSLRKAKACCHPCAWGDCSTMSLALGESRVQKYVAQLQEARLAGHDPAQVAVDALASSSLHFNNHHQQSKTN